MKPTFEQYIAQLADPAARISASQLRALSGLTPAQARALDKVWPCISLPLRRELVQTMVELAEDNVDLDFNPAFKLAMHDADEDVRRQAVEGLLEDEEVATADALVEALRNDPAPAVRAASAVTLGHFVYRLELDDLDQRTGDRIKTALYEVFDDQVEPLEVRRRALESLSFLSEDRARAAIAQSYGDAALKMRVSAVFGMGRSCDRRWLPAVLSELQSGSAEMRFEAARASGELEDKRAVPSLVHMLEDDDREVSVAAIDALGQIGGDEAKRALRTVLEGPDEDLVSAAEDALEEIEINEDVFRMPLSEREEE